jgi:hypothetical protein
MAEEKLETKKPEKAGCEFSFSDRLIGNLYLEEFKEKVEELKDLASKLAPGGELVVSVVTNGERFRPVERAMVNLTYMKRLYNERTLMAKPELANELGRVASILKQFNDMVNKRRAANTKAINQARKERKEKAAKATKAKQEQTSQKETKE